MLTAAVVQFLDGCYCFSVRNLIGYIFQQITWLAVEHSTYFVQNSNGKLFDTSHADC